MSAGVCRRPKIESERRDIRTVPEVHLDLRITYHVADNTAKFDITESECLLLGTNFGVGTDIQTGPNGNLFVVSLSNGAIHEIFKRP